MELHQIRYFLALARLRNFTRAAQECHVTQPALTKAIQKLEQDLGGPLIHRERQLTHLTDLGNLVLPILERAYATAESVRSSAEAFHRGAIAPLKVALTPCVCASLLEGPLAEIARFMPGLQVELVEVEPDKIIDRLLTGEANAAIAGGSIGKIPPRALHWALFEEQFLVLLPKDSILADQPAVELAQLAEAAWLVLQGQGEGAALREVFPSGVDPRVRHRCHGLGHLQHLVSAGLGLALWPEHAPPITPLTTRPIAGGGPKRTLQLIVVAGRRNSPALKALVRVARVHDWRKGLPAGPERWPDAREISRSQPQGFGERRCSLLKKVGPGCNRAAGSPNLLP